VVLGHFLTYNHPSKSFFLFSFNLNKWFSHISNFSFCVFVNSSPNCGVVMLVILCGVWFRLLSRRSFSFYWKISISQLQIQSMIWASTLQIRKHEYFGDSNFTILFVHILLLYAINLGAVSLLADSPFTCLTMFVSDVMYSINFNEWISFCFCKKKKRIGGSNTILLDKLYSMTITISKLKSPN